MLNSVQDRVVLSLESIADSLNKMLNFEQSQGTQSEDVLPFCPHCNVINPIITKLDDEDDRGEFINFFLKARCENCKETLYALPSWTIFNDREDAAEVLNKKLEAKLEFFRS